MCVGPSLALLADLSPLHHHYFASMVSPGRVDACLGSRVCCCTCLVETGGSASDSYCVVGRDSRGLFKLEIHWCSVLILTHITGGSKITDVYSLGRRMRALLLWLTTG